MAHTQILSLPLSNLSTPVQSRMHIAQCTIAVLKNKSCVHTQHSEEALAHFKFESIQDSYYCLHNLWGELAKWLASRSLCMPISHSKTTIMYRCSRCNTNQLERQWLGGWWRLEGSWQKLRALQQATSSEKRGCFWSPYIRPTQNFQQNKTYYQFCTRMCNCCDIMTKWWVTTNHITPSKAAMCSDEVTCLNARHGTSDTRQ